MSKTKRGLKESKRAIAHKTNEFEKRLMSAKNDLEQVQILNEMEELLQSEIIHWMDFLENEKTGTIEQQDKIHNAVADNVADLNSVIVKINEGRAELLQNAKAIAKAMKNSHQEVKPTKHITYEE